MEIGSKRLAAFLDRVNAHKSFGGDELERMGKYLDSPLSHPYQISSRRLTLSPRDLFVSEEGLWMYYRGHTDTDRCSASHVVVSPRGEQTMLPPEEYVHNIDTVKIHGVVNGRPVITVDSFFGHQLDEGLSMTHLCVGSERIKDQILHPVACVFDHHVYFLLWSSKESCFAKIVLLRDGEVEDVRDLVSTPGVIRDLVVTEHEFMIMTDDYRDKPESKQVITIGRNIDKYESSILRSTTVSNGELVVRAYKPENRVPHPMARYLESTDYHKVGNDQFAWRADAKDGLVRWNVNSADKKHENGTDLILPGPSFDAVSNLFKVEDRWHYYAAIGTMLYKMQLHL